MGSTQLCVRLAYSLLQKFFGSNPQAQQDYGDFIQRYQDDPTNISDEEAARRYREMMRHAPPDLAEQAHEHAFGQLPQRDRSALADRYRDAASDPNRPFDSYNYDTPTPLPTRAILAVWDTRPRSKTPIYLTKSSAKTRR
jgi:hypothetical protein